MTRWVGHAAPLHSCKYRRLRAPATIFNLDQEVARLWRPLAVSGRAQHSRQIALQRDLQLVAVGFEQDDLDQRTNGLYSSRAAVLALKGAATDSRPSRDKRQPCAGAAVPASPER
jgi:hypothetical protein